MKKQPTDVRIGQVVVHVQNGITRPAIITEVGHDGKHGLHVFPTSEAKVEFSESGTRADGAACWTFAPESDGPIGGSYTSDARDREHERRRQENAAFEQKRQLEVEGRRIPGDSAGMTSLAAAGNDDKGVRGPGIGYRSSTERTGIGTTNTGHQPGRDMADETPQDAPTTEVVAKRPHDHELATGKPQDDDTGPLVGRHGPGGKTK